MVEYHGWITLRDSPGEGEEDQTAQIAERLRAKIEQSGPISGLSVSNATYFVWFAGSRNHWGGAYESALDLMKRIAAAAPGSYGLLYVWDDEYDNHFRVWRLARGEVTEHCDTLLSPCIPTVEDVWNPPDIER